MRKIDYLLALPLMLVFIACGGSDAKTQNSNESPQELVLFGVWEALDYDLLKGVASDFEKENNVTITLQTTTSETFKNQFTTLLNSGSKLDVIGFNGMDMRYLYTSGSVFALSDYVDIDPSNYVDGALDTMTWDGKYYGLPYAAWITSMGTFYNKDIFAKYNLQPPKTFADLYKINDVLRANGLYALSFEGGNLYQWDPWYMIMLGQLTNGKPLDYTIEILKGNAKFTDDISVQAMQGVADLGAHKVWNDGFLGVPESDIAIALFTQGKAAMYQSGTWNLTSIRLGGMGDNLGVIPFPLMREGLSYYEPYALANPAIAGYAKADDKLKEVIAKFCLFASGKEVSQTSLMARCEGDLGKSMDIPVTLGVPYNDKDEILKQFQSYFPTIGQTFLGWYWPPVVHQEFLVQLQAVAGGEATARAAMEAIQAVFDQAVREGYEFR
jgi:raffinose/stachyose/melibiose transport system substrate-binding protein